MRTAIAGFDRAVSWCRIHTHDYTTGHARIKGKPTLCRALACRVIKVTVWKSLEKMLLSRGLSVYNDIRWAAGARPSHRPSEENTVAGLQGKVDQTQQQRNS